MRAVPTSSAGHEVLVVGAGPTGLLLAAQLLARGISVRIVDKNRSPLLQSRAISIQARTLELLEMMGLADAFIAQGHRVRRFRMYSGERPLLNLDMARNGSQHGFILHLPQAETERLLRTRVRELGGIVEQGRELVGLRQDGDGVDATLADLTGSRTEVRARYAVGCDGAHSRVRTELGVPFTGRGYPQDWLLADIALDGVGRDDELHAFFRPDGSPLVCLPLGGGRWRVVLPNAGDRGGRPPSFEEIQDFIQQRAPHPVSVSEPGWLSCFRCQLRSSKSYGRGRVLLAGDAAHVHSPAGGQGMNTGMMDAANLAWKLALVVKGRGPGGLLDTYGQERAPVAAAVLGFTDRMLGWSAMRNPVKRAVRDVLLPAVTGPPAVQSREARRLSQVSMAYPAGPLVRSGGCCTPAAGERVPDVEVDTGAGHAQLYGVLGGGRHVLLVSGADVRVALDSVAGISDLVDVVEGNLGPTRRRRPGAGGHYALVRPDGVLAVRGCISEVGPLLDYLQEFQPPAPVRRAGAATRSSVPWS